MTNSLIVNLSDGLTINGSVVNFPGNLDEKCALASSWLLCHVSQKKKLKKVVSKLLVFGVLGPSQYLQVSGSLLPPHYFK